MRCLVKEEIVELIGLDKRKFEVYKIDEKLEKERRVKIIYVKLKSKKDRCPKCNKFTSSVHDVLKPVKIIIRKDLLNKSMTIYEIARQNNVSEYTVRKELKIIMKDHSGSIKILPKIISFDDFKADTSYGKYAFIVNDPIYKCVH